MANKRKREEACNYASHPGFKFQPNDEEVIFYLMNKVRSGQNCDQIVECDVYNDKSPWHLFQQHHDSVSTRTKTAHLYVYTMLKKTSKKGGGRNYSREAKEGKWRGCTAAKPVYDRYNNKIGFKKQLKFLYDSKKHGEWIMHEYSLGVQQPIVISEIIEKNIKGRRRIEEDELLVVEKDTEYDDLFPEERDGLMDQQQHVVDNNKQHCLTEEDGLMNQIINQNDVDIFSEEYVGNLQDLVIDCDDLFPEESDGFMYQQQVMMEDDGGQDQRALNLAPEIENNSNMFPKECDRFMYQQQVDNYNMCSIEDDEGQERALNLVPEIGNNNNVIDTDDISNYAAYFGEYDQ